MDNRLRAQLICGLALIVKVVDAKGLVGKLPGNPASCPEEPCNSDPQHVLQALKWTSLAFGLILLLPLLMYYISKLISKIHSLCSNSETSTKKAAKMDAGKGKRRASNESRDSTKVSMSVSDQENLDKDDELARIRMLDMKGKLARASCASLRSSLAEEVSHRNQPGSGHKLNGEDRGVHHHLHCHQLQNYNQASTQNDHLGSRKSSSNTNTTATTNNNNNNNSRCSRTDVNDNLAMMTETQHEQSIQMSALADMKTRCKLQSSLMQLDAANLGLDIPHRKSFSNVTELEPIGKVEDESQRFERQQRARLHSMLNVDQLITYRLTRPASRTRKSHPSKVYPITDQSRRDESQYQLELAQSDASRRSPFSQPDAQDYMDRLSHEELEQARRQIQVDEQQYYQSKSPTQQVHNTLALPTNGNQPHRHSIDSSILNRMAHRMQQGCDQMSNLAGLKSDVSAGGLARGYIYNESTNSIRRAENGGLGCNSNNNNNRCGCDDQLHELDQQRGSSHAGGALTNKEPFSVGQNRPDRRCSRNSSTRRADRRDH